MKYSNFETIKTTFEFQNVYNNGASFANRDFVIYVAKNDCGKRRLGVSVSKKIGNSVTRHRLSRLVREAFRLNASSVDEDIDIVVIIRSHMVGKGYKEAESSMLHLLRKHNVISM